MRTLRIDVRGQRCPWPVLRLARAMREFPDLEAIGIEADDPAAEAEITALATERGWSISTSNLKESRFFQLNK